MSKNFELKGLAHICIYTKDLDKSIRFYTDNLSFKVVYRTEVTIPSKQMKYALIKLNTCAIELLEPLDHDAAKEKVRGTIDHIAIEVGGIENLVSCLKSEGINIIKEITYMENLFSGVKGAFISGPSGEIIELFEYMSEYRGL